MSMDPFDPSTAYTVMTIFFVVIGLMVVGSTVVMIVILARILPLVKKSLERADESYERTEAMISSRRV